MYIHSHFISRLLSLLRIICIFIGILSIEIISSVYASSSILGSTGMNPVGITIDSTGNIYTANRSSNTVTKITPDGTSSVFGTTGAGPFFMVMDSMDNIYITNQWGNTVTKITPDGTSSVFGTTGAGPRGIAIDSVGNIYTANRSSNTVTKITPDGTSSVFGATGLEPYGIIVDLTGNVYTTNQWGNTVTKITPDGTSSIFGTTGTTPIGITIDSIGNIYTANYGNNTLTKITPDGTSSIFGTTGLYPFGITIDNDDNLYITNQGSSTVSKITPDGTSSVFGTTGTNPLSIIGDMMGNIYVVNGGDSTVSKISPDIIDNTPPTAIIAYSHTGITNQPVIVTLTGTSEPITITNNSGSNTYTFTSNGIFTFDFIDTAGNTGSTTATVTNIDTILPVITLIGSEVLNIYSGSIYTESGALWTDTIDGSGLILFPYSGSVNTSQTGIYILTYTYVDTAGNTGTTTRTVSVIDTEPIILPVIVGGGGSTGYSKNTNQLPSQDISISVGVELNAPSQLNRNVPGIHRNVNTLILDNQKIMPIKESMRGFPVFTLENPKTEFICAKIVKVWNEERVVAMDIPNNEFQDSLKGLIMFRAIEKDEDTTGQTMETYKNQGVMLNNESLYSDQNTTRAEFVKMVVRSLSCHYSFLGKDSGFSDVSPDMWYAEYITFAAKNGWISGFSDGKFYPDAPISRGEMAKILANAIHLNLDNNSIISNEKTTNKLNNAPTDNLTINIHDVLKNNIQTTTREVVIPKEHNNVSGDNEFLSYIEQLRIAGIINNNNTGHNANEMISRKEVSSLIYKTFFEGK